MTEFDNTFDLQKLLLELRAQAGNGFPDTGEYDEAEENQLRGLLAQWVAYVEEGSGYDPEGNYRCGTCAVRIMPQACRWVSGKISMETGSCRTYWHGPNSEEQDPAPKQMSQVEAQYGERPEAKGFGCKRCEYGVEAKKPDAKGRPSWCRFWGIHIQPNACCAMNEGEDSKEAPGE